MKYTEHDKCREYFAGRDATVSKPHGAFLALLESVFLPAFVYNFTFPFLMWLKLKSFHTADAIDVLQSACCG